MTHYAIATDLNRCVGCLGCSVACKALNNVPIGNFWNKVLRIGPNPTEGGSGHFPDVEMYFLTVQCQHCSNPPCVHVCPTRASHIADDGTVQIDKRKCIGCRFCVMACPYGVRYLNQEERVVEKCTMCEQLIGDGSSLPQCVSQCGGMARYFGDLDKGIASFRGPCDTTLGAFIEPYGNDDIHHLPNVDNQPSFVYILRNRTWRGGGGR